MSKVPWVLFPDQTTKTPVKVRFIGEPVDDVAARQLASAYGGLIKQFYVKAAQGHALGTPQDTYRRMKYADMQLDYSNINGQEIVEVRVTPGAIKRAAGPDAPPDYCIVNFVIDGDWDLEQDYVRFKSYGVTPNVNARIVRPGFDTAEDEDGLPPYVGTDDYSDQCDKPLMEFAASETMPEGSRTIAIEPRTASLLIDMSELPKRDRVVLEIWAGGNRERTTPVPEYSQGAFSGYDTTINSVSISRYTHTAGFDQTNGVHWDPDGVTWDDAAQQLGFPTGNTVQETYEQGILVRRDSNVITNISIDHGGGPGTTCPVDRPYSHFYVNWTERIYTWIVQTAVWELDVDYYDEIQRTELTGTIQHEFLWGGKPERVVADHSAIWVPSGRETLVQSKPIAAIPIPFLGGGNAEKIGTLTIDRYPPSIRFDPV